MPDTVRRVLVVTKYRFIGDTLTAIPTLRAIKDRWPNAELTLLSGARACELLQNCPYVDRFVEFDPYRACDKGLRRYIKLVLELQRNRFDLAIVLNRSFHSALTASLGGARRRSGWSGFEGRDFLLTQTCEYDKNKPEIDCFLDVLGNCTDTLNSSRRLELWLTDSELAVAKAQLPTGGPVVAVQPGATHDYKRWPTNNFVELCERLLSRIPDVRFVLIGGPDEKPFADKFLGESSALLAARVLDTVGQISLRMTLATVAQVDAFVGNDTAIRHAAVALDVVSIGLFGPTSCTKWGNALPPRHLVLVSPTGAMEDVLVDAALEPLSQFLLGDSATATCRGEIEPRQSAVNRVDRPERIVSDVKLVLERSWNE